MTQAGEATLPEPAAPGLRTLEDIQAVVRAIDRPLNVIGAGLPYTREQLEQAGVRRISVGGALARTAWAGFLQAARTIGAEGRFDGLAHAASGKELNGFFGK